MSLDMIMSCGELSGDLALYELLQPLQNKLQGQRIEGVWGPHMMRLGLTPTRSLDGLQVMGVMDLLSSLPRLYQHKQWLVQEIINKNPKVVLCSDYPGLHLSLGKQLRQRGFKGKLIQYVAPSIWAWKVSRLATLELFFDEIWGILPCEAEAYEHSKIPYRYVGNPSWRQFQREEEVRKDPSVDTIALLPGSRPSEVRQHLSIMLEAAETFERHTHPRLWKLVLAHESLFPLMEQEIERSSLKIEWVMPHERMEAMQSFGQAVAVSGSVCLELALRNVPTISLYSMGYLDYCMARYIFQLNLPFYTLPNLLLAQPLFPELVGPHLSPYKIVDALQAWEGASSSYQATLAGCAQLRQRMATAEGSSQQTAALEQLMGWLQ